MILSMIIVKIRDGWYKTCRLIVYLALGGVKRWDELNGFIDLSVGMVWSTYDSSGPLLTVN